MYDSSFGIIPLRKNVNDVWEVLLIQNRRGSHWSFPKGHAEGDETPFQAANREFQEETGLTIVELLFPTPLIEEYHFDLLRGSLFLKV